MSEEDAGTKGDAGEETAPLHMETKDSKENLRYG